MHRIKYLHIPEQFRIHYADDDDEGNDGGNDDRKEGEQRRAEQSRGEERRGENLLSTQLKLACIYTWFIAIHIPDLFGIYCDDGNE